MFFSQGENKEIYFMVKKYPGFKNQGISSENDRLDLWNLIQKKAH